jgi:hypothetical protein
LPDPAEAILLGFVQNLNCFQTDTLALTSVGKTEIALRLVLSYPAYPERPKVVYFTPMKALI